MESLGLVAIPQQIETGRVAIMVAYLIEGSPAEAAGIQPGDEVIAVNGTSVNGFSTVGAPIRIHCTLFVSHGESGAEISVKISDSRVRFSRLGIFNFLPKF